MGSPPSDHPAVQGRARSSSNTLPAPAGEAPTLAARALPGRSGRPQLVQILSHRRQRRRPVPGRGLAKDPNGGGPEAVLVIPTPAPDETGLDQEPAALTELAGEVGGGVGRRDHEIAGGDQGPKVVDGVEGVEPGVGVDCKPGGVPELGALRAGVAGLTGEQARVRECEGSGQGVERDRPCSDRRGGFSAGSAAAPMPSTADSGAGCLACPGGSCVGCRDASLQRSERTPAGRGLDSPGPRDAQGASIGASHRSWPG